MAESVFASLLLPPAMLLLFYSLYDSRILRQTCFALFLQIKKDMSIDK